MDKKLLIFFFGIFLVSGAFAQEAQTVQDYDRLTYELWAGHQWDGLISTGEDALKEGHDFFLLRLRLGIAYYQLSQYERARKHFQRALDFQKKDPYATEYLYFSNIFSGRYSEARMLLPDLSQAKRKEIHAAGKYSLSAFFAEGGWFGNSSVEDLKSIIPATNYSVNYFMRQILYNNLGLIVNTGFHSNLTFSYNHFIFNNIQQVYTNDSLYSFDQQGKQNGFYLKYVYSFADAWYAGLSYHGISGNYDLAYPREEISVEPVFFNSGESYRQSFVGGFVGKHFRYTDVSVNFSRNSFWDGVYFQAGGRMILYPAGNLKYYLGGSFDRLVASGAGLTSANVWKAMAGFTLLRYIQLEGSHIFGDLSNWSDAGGYYLFNTVYPIRSRTGMTLSISGLHPNLTIQLSGFLQNRDHYSQSYSTEGTIIDEVLQSFQSTSIFGGLTWIF